MEGDRAYVHSLPPSQTHTQTHTATLSHPVDNENEYQRGAHLSRRAVAGGLAHNDETAGHGGLSPECSEVTGREDITEREKEEGGRARFSIKVQPPTSVTIRLDSYIDT